MRVWVGAAVLMFAGCGHAAAAPAPAYHRIMSLKLCTDELLMDLVSPSRIASISVLSRERAALRLWPQAADIRVNHNTAEEVLAARPDLVLTDAYTAPAMRTLLAKSGARIVEVPDAENFDQIRAVTRLVGDAVDARPRAEALIARMDGVLAMLARNPPMRPVRVLGWGGGGFVPGTGTLFDAVARAAGGVAVGGGFRDVESVLAQRPDVLAFGDDYVDAPSLRDDQNGHPLLKRYYGNRSILYPSALLGCGLPQSADAAARMRRDFAVAMSRPGDAP